MKHRYTALTGIVLGAALLLSAIGCTGAPAGSSETHHPRRKPSRRHRSRTPVS